MLRLIQPFYLSLIISYFTPNSHDSKTILSDHRELSESPEQFRQKSDELRILEGVLGVVGMMISLLIYCVVQHTYSNEMFHFGMKIRVSSTSVIYRKYDATPLHLRHPVRVSPDDGHASFSSFSLYLHCPPSFAVLSSHQRALVGGTSLVLTIGCYSVITHSYAFGLAHLSMKIKVAVMAQPFILGRLLSYFKPNSRMSLTDGLVACSYMIGLQFITLFFYHTNQFNIFHHGMKVRVACCTVLYRKALRLSKTALGETTVGQVVNLLSNDVNRFDTAFIFLHHLWVGPLLTVIVTYFLYDLIGLSSLIGVAVLLAFIPFQIYLGKKTSELRLKTALRTDERVRLMNEIISGIQVIKMYAWEKSFASMVTQARKKEIRQIKGSTYIKGVLLSFIIFHTRIALFCSILAYVLSGHGISAEKVFVVTAYFNILRQSMTVFFPQGIGMTAEALVSVKRLQKFLLYDETQVAPSQLPPPSSEDKTSPMYEDTITSLPHNGEVESSNHQNTVTSMGNGRTPSQTGIFIKNIKQMVS
ncbi:hypothetical protein WDU94_002614 [Cyamophila willieti]